MLRRQAFKFEMLPRGRQQRVIHRQQTDCATDSGAAGGRGRWTGAPVSSAALVLRAALVLSVALCGQGARAAADNPAPFYANTFAKPPSAAAMAAVGRRLFFDKSLSASGKISCASCHDPGRAFGPPNDLPVQSGGGDGRRTGVRAVPSLTYTQGIPPFTEHFFDDEGDDSIDQGPAG